MPRHSPFTVIDCYYYFHFPLEEEQEKFRTKIYQRCKLKNSPDSKFCNACGLPLDVKVAMELDQARCKADKLMTELIKSPRVIDVLLEAIERITSQES